MEGELSLSLSFWVGVKFCVAGSELRVILGGTKQEHPDCAANQNENDNQGKSKKKK